MNPISFRIWSNEVRDANKFCRYDVGNIDFYDIEGFNLWDKKSLPAQKKQLASVMMFWVDKDEKKMLKRKKRKAEKRVRK